MTDLRAYLDLVGIEDEARISTILYCIPPMDQRYLKLFFDDQEKKRKAAEKKNGGSAKKRTPKRGR